MSKDDDWTEREGEGGSWLGNTAPDTGAAAPSAEPEVDRSAQNPFAPEQTTPDTGVGREDLQTIDLSSPSAPPQAAPSSRTPLASTDPERLAKEEARLENMRRAVEEQHSPAPQKWYEKASQWLKNKISGPAKPKTSAKPQEVELAEQTPLASNPQPSYGTSASQDKEVKLKDIDLGHTEPVPEPQKTNKIVQALKGVKNVASKIASRVSSGRGKSNGQTR